MERKEAGFTFTFFLCLLVSLIFPEAYGARTEEQERFKKLFVFGDSYADTGNWERGTSPSWKEPYGMTFPGKPSGRYTDGRTLTDYIGAGVFDTVFTGAPNMTTQIDLLRRLIENKVFTEHDMTSSVAFVTVSGNDYTTSLTDVDDLQVIQAFVKSVIGQLELNLGRIHGMGVSKVAVASMEPFGCLPSCSKSYTTCSEKENSISRLHNLLLRESIEKLNNEMAARSTTFVILDLYTAFMSAMNIQDNHFAGNSSFEKTLKPCCVGGSDKFECGDVNEENGKKKEYILCENPNNIFFWDGAHPTQQGWFTVFSALKPSLQTLLWHQNLCDSFAAAAI